MGNGNQGVYECVVVTFDYRDGLRDSKEVIFEMLNYRFSLIGMHCSLHSMMTVQSQDITFLGIQISNRILDGHYKSHMLNYIE